MGRFYAIIPFMHLMRIIYTKQAVQNPTHTYIYAYPKKADFTPNAVLFHDDNSIATLPSLYPR